MREYSTPSDVPGAATGNLTDDVVRNAEQHPDWVAFSRRTSAPGGGRPAWTDVSASDFLTEVRRTAKGLLAAGIEAGDRVVILARTRYEWTLADYALWFCGAVSVPVYETSSAEQISWILTDSGARAAIVETPRHAQRLREAGGGEVDRLWVLEGGSGSERFSDLAELGVEVSDADLETRRTSITPDHPATLLYTSGTTGPPRGCVLTHGNFQCELTTTLQELKPLFEVEDAATLLALPLAHVFARIVQVGAVRARVRLGHAPDIRRLLDDLRDFRPSFVLGVPRIFERIVNTASQRAVAEGRGRVFERAVDAAIGYSQSLDRGRPNPLQRGRHVLFERLVFSRLREELGGRCQWAVSGGAPLGERLGHFYRGIGIPVLEGYGLTETTGAVTVNTPDNLRIGTVGRPLPGTEIRVADDGELLVRGGQVMSGYWQDREGTAEAISADGWLQTGDLGEIDDEGFVRVIGRRKEILVTSGGKNVSPAMLEDRLRAHPLVGQCLVVGDGRPYVAALVTLDPDAYADWAEQRGRSPALGSAVRDPDVRAEVQAAIDDTNSAVSQAESIRRFEILPVAWAEETGELTPSLKLKRNVVTRTYRQQIAELYDA